jgi:hypothetical protein
MVKNPLTNKYMRDFSKRSRTNECVFELLNMLCMHVCEYKYVIHFYILSVNAYICYKNTFIVQKKISHVKFQQGIVSGLIGNYSTFPPPSLGDDVYVVVLVMVSYW